MLFVFGIFPTSIRMEGSEKNEEKKTEFQTSLTAPLKAAPWPRFHRVVKRGQTPNPHKSEGKVLD